MKKIWLSWDQYNDFVMEIVNQIRNDDFKPDLVVGIARGGLPLLATIANYFGIREVGVMFVQKTATDAHFASRLPNAVLQGLALPFNSSNKNVLLVDDIIRSGQTIKLALEALYSFDPSSVKIISLYKQSNAYDFKPYSPAEAAKEDWIVFPWESLQ